MARSLLSAKMATTAPTGEPKWDAQAATLELQIAAISGGLPVWNSRAFTYVAAGAADDDDVLVVTYKLNGVSVATVTYTYVGSTNNVLTETLAIL